jgi:hypothetical protein
LDLLPLPRSTACSEVVIFACRLLGCAAIVAIADVSAQHAGMISASQIFPLGLLVMTVALLVGHLIKEVSILVGVIAMTRLGLKFRRTPLTLNGAQSSEAYQAEGTWDRYILERTKSFTNDRIATANVTGQYWLVMLPARPLRSLTRCVCDQLLVGATTAWQILQALCFATLMP